MLQLLLIMATLTNAGAVTVDYYFGSL